MYINKNITAIVLAVVMISALAITTFASVQDIWYENLEAVTVDRVYVKRIADKTEEAFLRTSSETVSHMDYAAIGCMESGCVGWEESYSSDYDYVPTPARASITFPSSCWNLHSEGEHGSAFFEVIEE